MITYTPGINVSLMINSSGMTYGKHYRELSLPFQKGESALITGIKVQCSIEPVIKGRC